MKLIRPCDEYKDQFLQMVEAFAEEGTTGFWLYYGGEPFSYEKFIDIDGRCAVGGDLPSGKVQATTYWLVDGETLVGHTNIRHELNEALLQKNGNIGYHIAPDQRRKGYGSKILSLALDKCREFGLEKALVTCDEDNVGSAKVIEKNGGVLENTIQIEGDDFRTKRYWITL